MVSAVLRNLLVVVVCVEPRRHHRACILNSRERNSSVQNEIPKKGVPNFAQNEEKKTLSHNARHLIRILLVILRIRRIIRGVRGLDGYRSGNMVVIRDA